LGPPDQRGYSSHLDSLGVAFKNLGQYGSAIEHYERAFVIEREIGDALRKH